MQNNPFVNPKEVNYECYINSYIKYSSLFITVVGVGVIFGWIYNISMLKSVFPGFLNMNPLTAVCLILLGLATLIHPYSADKYTKFLSYLLISSVLMVNLLKIADYIGLYPFGIDQILFRSELQGNKMAPNVAISFILLSIALLLTNIKFSFSNKISQAFSAISFIIGLHALYAYSYKAHSWFNKDVPIALNTAVALIMISIAIFLIRYEKGYGKLIFSKTSAGYISRKFIPLSLTLPLLFGLWRLFAEKEGFVNVEFGISLFTLFSAIFSLCLIFLISQALYKSELSMMADQQHALKLASIVETSDDAIVSISIDGLIQSWNIASRNLFGYSKEEIIGKPYSILVPRPLYTEEDYILKQMREGDRIQGYETIRINKSREYINVSLTISPIRDNSGNIIAYSNFIRDITESKKVKFKIKTLNEELEQTNLELENRAKQLDEQYEIIQAKNIELEKAYDALQMKMEQLEITGKYKSNFLANMSHELRTPLNSILILSKVLSENKNSGLTPKEVEFANIIYNSGTDLLTLINDILDFARIESGKIKIENDEFDPRDIKIESLFEEFAKSKAINFSVTRVENLPFSINTDRFRVEQILKNLLSNAFKFTPTGGNVNMMVYYNHPSVVFSVSDTGIGISQENQKLIFEAFHQADGSINKKFGGTGLGLSISKELAILLGGKITLESEEGQGSVFSLHLPVSTSSLIEEICINDNIKSKKEQPKESISFFHRDKENVDMEAKVLSLKNKKVLIVDDDIKNIYALHNILEEYKMNIKTAFSGKEAIEYLQANSLIDVILIDIMMPDLNGYETMRIIKENNKLQQIPIIALTAKAMTDDREKCIEAGANDYFSKPVNINALISRIAEVV